MEPFINILLEDLYEPDDKGKKKKAKTQKEPMPDDMTTPESDVHKPTVEHTTPDPEPTKPVA